MNHDTAMSMRDEYLRRLDDALGSLPHRIAIELRDGIAEELDGLDDAVTAERISALGEPADIARAAAEAEADRAEIAAAPALEAAPVPVLAPSPAPKAPVTATRGYAIASAIVLGLGGLLVPVVGWLVGVGMVSYSRLWRTREKAWAFFAPFAIAAALYSAMWLFSQGDGGPDGERSTLMPTLFDTLWSGVVIAYVVLVPFTGLWLLLRLRGRSSDPNS